MAIARRPNDATEPVIDLLEFRPCPDPAQWGATLAALVRDHGLKGLETVAVLDPGDYQLTQIEAPEVPPEELREAIRWRLKEFLTYRAEDAVVDGFEVPQAKGRPGSRMLFAVAAPKKTVARVAEALEVAGLEPAAIDIPELALRNLTAEVPDQAGGVALVTLEDASGLITITQAETLYLARALEFGQQQLESNPAAYGDSLVLELQRSLDYYESQLAGRPASRVLVAPLAGDRDGLLARMNEQMGMASFGLDLGQLVELSQDAPAELQAQGLCAVGAALRREAAA